MASYLLGGLEPAELADLRAHLATGCPECAGSLAEAQATLAQLPSALPPLAPPPQLRQQLLNRINNASPKLAIAPQRRRIFIPTAIAACIGLMVGALIWNLAVRAPEQSRLLAAL